MDKALETYQELLSKSRASNADPQNDLRDWLSFSRTYAALTLLLARAGRASEVASFDHQRHELWKHWDQKVPNNPFVLRQLASSRGNWYRFFLQLAAVTA